MIEPFVPLVLAYVGALAVIRGWEVFKGVIGW